MSIQSNLEPIYRIRNIQWEACFIANFINYRYCKEMNIHNGTNLQDIHRALASKYLSIDLISEFECMRSQGEVMQSIRQLLQKKSNTNPSSSNFNMDNFDASSIQLVNNYSNDDSLIKSKFTQEFQQSIVNAALKEVKNNCSSETYETVFQYVHRNNTKESETNDKKVQQLKEEKQDAAARIMILQLQKNAIEKELQKFRVIVNSVEEEKNSVKKRIDYVLRKENQIYKLQTSFAFKEKISLQLKKRYERLRDMTLSNEQKIEQMLVEQEQIWSFISNKMDSVDCPGSCWKKDAMRRARQQLILERKLLKQEKRQIEKQYEIMNIVSSQFKKIFHEPERNHENGSNFKNKRVENQSVIESVQ